jgi:hypothetical protein
MVGAGEQAKVGSPDRLASTMQRNMNFQGPSVAHGCHDAICQMIQRLGSLIVTSPPSRILYCDAT